MHSLHYVDDKEERFVAGWLMHQICTSVLICILSHSATRLSFIITMQVVTILKLASRMVLCRVGLLLE